MYLVCFDLLHCNCLSSPGSCPGPDVVHRPSGLQYEINLAIIICLLDVYWLTAIYQETLKTLQRFSINKYPERIESHIVAVDYKALCSRQSWNEQNQQIRMNSVQISNIIIVMHYMIKGK